MYNKLAAQGCGLPYNISSSETVKPETVLHVRRLKLHRRRRKGHCGGVWRIQF